MSRSSGKRPGGEPGAGPGITVPPAPRPERTVFVLVGPTGSGKTRISLALSRLLPVEIISADSRQVYRMMEIGSAQPSHDELGQVRHHFVGEMMPDEEFNAGEYGKRGRAVIDEILGRGKFPLVVGGSGLYIRGLIDGFFDGPSADEEIRSGLEESLGREGAAALLEELRRVDPASAARMIPGHKRRIVRALEVYRITGVPLSEIQQSRVAVNFRPVMAGVMWDRGKLYRRINERVDAMMRGGFLEEVRKLRGLGYAANLRSLRTVGYVELNAFLDGRLPLEASVALIKQNSRRYAKRQLTWFRRDERVRWFPVEEEKDLESIASDIAGYFAGSSSRALF